MWATSVIFKIPAQSKQSSIGRKLPNLVTLSAYFRQSFICTYVQQHLRRLCRTEMIASSHFPCKHCNKSWQETQLLSALSDFTFLLWRVQTRGLLPRCAISQNWAQDEIFLWRPKPVFLDLLTTIYIRLIACRTKFKITGRSNKKRNKGIIVH
jgi:hypothetical protein